MSLSKFRTQSSPEGRLGAPKGTELLFFFHIGQQTSRAQTPLPLPPSGPSLGRFLIPNKPGKARASDFYFFRPPTSLGGEMVFLGNKGGGGILGDNGEKKERGGGLFDEEFLTGADGRGGYIRNRSPSPPPPIPPCPLFPPPNSRFLHTPPPSPRPQRRKRATDCYLSLFTPLFLIIVRLNFHETPPPPPPLPVKESPNPGK